MPSLSTPHRWVKEVVRAAGIYNLLWGFAVVCFPDATLRFAGFSTPIDYPALWQCIGMIVGVYGIGYLIACRDPLRHWPIVCAGLLGKIFGPVGLLMGLLNGTLPSRLWWTILTNDLIWWIPFAMILWQALRHHHASVTVHAELSPDDDPVHELIGSGGKSLFDLSIEQPQLVVFLRHAGCTFCREAVADLGRQQQQIAASGAGVAIVHLGAETATLELLRAHGLGDVQRFSDPRGRLYRQFGLEMGRFTQLLGLKVWTRGVRAGILGGHGIGPIMGNPFQMPGVFVMYRGRLVCGFQHDSAADRLNFLQFIRDALDRVEATAVPLHSA